MAAESGQEVSWDEAMNSNLQLAPGLDQMTMDSPAPVQARRRRPVSCRFAWNRQGLLIVPCGCGILPQSQFKTLHPPFPADDGFVNGEVVG